MPEQTKTAQLTRASLLRKIKTLGPLAPEVRNRVVCSLVGHSRVQTRCFGYYYCARCGDQLGDQLGSVYSGAETAVVVGHDCKTCRSNAKTLTWRDTLFTPNPFKREARRAK